MEKILIKTVSSRILEARFVEKGDAYGHSAIWKSDSPGVDFLDVTTPECQHPTGCQYHIKTLLRDSDDSAGLCLHGGCPEWNVPADEFKQLKEWLLARTTAKEVRS